VIEGYRDVAGLGGGFRFCTLGEPLFDQGGQVCRTVTFSDLARHVFFTETGEPLPKATNGKSSPLIGVCNGVAYYLLFNGVLGDKSPDGGNVLTSTVLRTLPPHDGPRVVIGEGCRLGRTRLKREKITFKQIPYEIKVS
jgi:adenine-specific DNA-methyltransferase